mgnify:CR=1 FL=1
MCINASGGALTVWYKTKIYSRRVRTIYRVSKPISYQIIFSYGHIVSFGPGCLSRYWSRFEWRRFLDSKVHSRNLQEDKFFIFELQILERKMVKMRISWKKILFSISHTVWPKKRPQWYVSFFNVRLFSYDWKNSSGIGYVLFGGKFELKENVKSYAVQKLERTP